MLLAIYFCISRQAQCSQPLHIFDSTAPVAEKQKNYMTLCPVQLSPANIVIIDLFRRCRRHRFKEAARTDGQFAQRFSGKFLFPFWVRRSISIM
jgi:hypothetical protein